jgi:ATP-dependent exoDNAse (exonuclease V) beta subunit
MELHPLATLLGKVRGGGFGAYLRGSQDRLEGSVADAYGALVAAPDAMAFAELLADLEVAIGQRKRADAVLTFDDLLRGAYGVLAAHPGVARRYGRRYRAVLVDEFQDTDAIQDAVIRRVADGGDAVLFVVGDEKQSIYRFRGAEIAVFKETRDRLGASYPLGRNFRSQPGVLRFINRVATAMFQVPAGALEPEQWTAFDATQRLVPHRPTTRQTPAVRLVTLVDVLARRRATAAEAREIEARVLAEVLAELSQRRGDPVAFGDVAVLFRTLNQVKAYEYALARRGIPYYVVKGRGFFQCQEVRDVVNLLGAVARTDDGIALAAVLRSPFFGVGDDTLWRLAWPDGSETPTLPHRFRQPPDLGDLGADTLALGRARALLADLRRLRNRSAIAELLVRALAATDLEAVYLTQSQGRQKVANVRKVIELARDFDRHGEGGIAEFVRRLRALDADDPREAEALLASEHDQVVRLMTIHQAKGLEFPVVVLVDLGRALERDRETVVVDPDHGLLAAPLFGPGGQTMRHAGLEAFRAREQERAQAEYARLLYVACTRAADELVLIEGRGKASHLDHGDGDPHVWCHRLWDVIGRAPVAAAAREGRADTVALDDDTVVAIEPADRYVTPEDAAPFPPFEPREGAATVEAVALVERVLGFEPPRPREVTTTPTALAAFRRCPRQYWYRHVLGLGDAGAGGRRARLAGMLAHGILEQVDYAHPVDDVVLHELGRRSPESLQLTTAEIAAVVTDLGAATALVGRAIGDGLELVAREEAVTLGLPAAAPEVVLHGRIDVLGRRAGAFVVQDYKYAEATAARVVEYADQLAAYRVAVARLTDAPVGGEILFLRGSPCFVSLAPLDVPRAEAELLDAGRALGAVLGRRDADAFPRRPAAPEACRALGCGFVRRCWSARGTRVTDSAPGDGHRTDGA